LVIIIFLTRGSWCLDAFERSKVGQESENAGCDKSNSIITVLNLDIAFNQSA